MSSCGNCGCQIPEVVNIPGTAGDPGANGTAGVSAWTITTSIILTPASSGPVTATATLASNLWLAVGSIVWITDGTNFGTFQVTAVSGDGYSVALTWLDYPDDSAGPITIAAGAKVVVAGLLGFTPPLPEADGGTGFSTLAAALAANVGNYPIATGQTTLVGGTITISTETITASSMIFVSLITMAGTRTSFGGYTVTGIAIGAPGSFDINARTVTDTALAACTDVVNYLIIG